MLNKLLSVKASIFVPFGRSIPTTGGYWDEKAVLFKYDMYFEKGNDRSFMRICVYKVFFSIKAFF